MPNTPIRLERPPRGFTVFRDEKGRWVASENQGLTGGIFFTLEAARCFAMREAGTDSGTIHIGIAPVIRH